MNIFWKPSDYSGPQCLCFWLALESRSQSDLLFSRKSDRKKEKSVVSFTHEQNIICSQTLKNQTQLEDSGHKQTIIRRQSFAPHVRGCRPIKREKKWRRMIMALIWSLKLWSLWPAPRVCSKIQRASATAAMFVTACNGYCFRSLRLQRKAGQGCSKQG